MSATYDETAEAVLTRCRECQAEIKLPCPDGEPNPLALKFADMMVCNSCAERHETETERAEQAEHLRRRLDTAGLPVGLRGLTFEQMDRVGARSAAVDQAARWAVNRRPQPPGILLYGPVGAGKTRLAATTANVRLEHGPLRWVSVAILLAQVAAAFGDTDRREAVKVLTGTGPLILDDIDKITATDWAKAQLFAAIDRRVQAAAPMILTTNLPPEQLASKLGDPIASRLAGYCRGAIFEMDGPDRRLAPSPVEVTA